jgi:hypothetical protein
MNAEPIGRKTYVPKAGQPVLLIIIKPDNYLLIEIIQAFASIRVGCARVRHRFELLFPFSGAGDGFFSLAVGSHKPVFLHQSELLKIPYGMHIARVWPVRLNELPANVVQ